MKSFSICIVTLLGMFAAAVVFMATPSRADGADVSWQRFYAGLHGGWAQATHKVTGGLNATGSLFDGSDPNPTPFSINGVFGGATVGFNYEVIKQPRVLGVVVGLEADIGYLGLSKTSRSGPGPPFADAGNHARARYRMYGDVTGRVGVTYQDILAYFKGGLALANISNEACDLDGTPPICDPADYTSVRKTKAGFAIGSGVEISVFDGISAKVEYLYMDFGTFKGSNIDGNRIRNKNHLHTVKFGVNISLDSIISLY